VSASDALSGVQFSGDYHYDEDTEEAWGDVYAHHNGKEVGHFGYEPWHSGGISPTTFHVDPDHRRQGIGSGLYDRAIANSGGPIVHDVGTMSPEGKATAAAHERKNPAFHDWV
jgi:GNAT superfamily N-acetyltransferase